MKTSTLRIKEVRFQTMESPEIIPFMFKSSFEVQKQVFGFLWVSVISFNMRISIYRSLVTCGVKVEIQ